MNIKLYYITNKILNLLLPTNQINTNIYTYKFDSVTPICDRVCVCSFELFHLQQSTFFNPNYEKFNNIPNIGYSINIITIIINVNVDRYNSH